MRFKIKPGLIGLLLLLLLVNVYIAMDHIIQNQQVSELKRQLAVQKKENEDSKDLNAALMIQGYMTGYLNSKDPESLTEEIPELALLTVEYAREFKINPYEAMFICQIENGFNLYRVGTSGEQGPAQLMESTWELYAKKFGYQSADFYDWKCNYRVAIAFYADLKKQSGGDIQTAIGFYNGGVNWRNKESTQRHIKRYMTASRGGLLIR
jgi:soluble lytic murein transglycosylase-like protein